jgi:hypothetical protein
MNQYLQASKRLHQYIYDQHWEGGAIVGPDPIGRIYWRVTRFLRSYLPWLPGDERYVYLQGQAYWIRGNLALFKLTHDPRFLKIAEQCADYVVRCQPADGAWRHPPIRERRGFISTVEGVWACLGLTAAYKALGKPSYLNSVFKWLAVQFDEIGFEEADGGLAANYYAHTRSKVPNVTTMLIWLTAELYRITGDREHLEYTGRMLSFIEGSQLKSGELPYAVGYRTHFMCFQYNSFQFLDLAHYYRLTCDECVWPILSSMARYLSTGVTGRGTCRCDCRREVPDVNYWTGAIASALLTAHEMGLGDYLAISERAYGALLAQQRPDGGFDFSRRDYGLMHDRRSYPRYLAMILCHLLHRAQTESQQLTTISQLSEHRTTQS